MDVTVQQSVLQTLIKLSQQEKIAIILITHDIGVIAETCDYVYVLRYGRHVEQNATNKVLQRPTQDYTRSLMASVPLIEKRLHRFALNEEDKLEDTSTGLHYLQEKQTTQDSTNESLLEVRNLSKIFVTPSSLLKAKQSFTAVKGVNFTVQRGETVGIVGAVSYTHLTLPTILLV